MTHGNQFVVDRWAIAATRAPRMAARRAILTVVVRAGLLGLMALGLMHTRTLVLWGLRMDQSIVLTLIATHFIAVFLAVGLPAVRRESSEQSRSFLGALRHRYADRTDRLRALSRVIALETGVLFAYPPIMALAAGRQLRWPVEFVIAVTSWMIVWPLYRIARAQRREAERLTALPTE